MADHVGSIAAGLAHGDRKLARINDLGVQARVM
jgi:hypothetical protein